MITERPLGWWLNVLGLGLAIRPEVGNFTVFKELVHVVCTRVYGRFRQRLPFGPLHCGIWFRRTPRDTSDKCTPRLAVRLRFGVWKRLVGSSVKYGSVTVTFYMPLPVAVVCCYKPRGSSVT